MKKVFLFLATCCITMGADVTINVGGLFYHNYGK